MYDIGAGCWVHFHPSLVLLFSEMYIDIKVEYDCDLCLTLETYGKKLCLVIIIDNIDGIAR